MEPGLRGGDRVRALRDAPRADARSRARSGASRRRGARDEAARSLARRCTALLVARRRGATLLPLLWMVSASLMPAGEATRVPAAPPARARRRSRTTARSSRASISRAPLANSALLAARATVDLARAELARRLRVREAPLRRPRPPLPPAARRARDPGADRHAAALPACCSELGLVNTYCGVIVPGIASIFGIFLVRQYALVDPRQRCSTRRASTAPASSRIFWSVVLPLCRPVLVTLAHLHVHGHVERLPLAADRADRRRPAHAAGRAREPARRARAGHRADDGGRGAHRAARDRALRRAAALVHRGHRERGRARVRRLGPLDRTHPRRRGARRRRARDAAGHAAGDAEPGARAPRARRRARRVSALGARRAELLDRGRHAGRREGGRALRGRRARGRAAGVLDRAVPVRRAGHLRDVARRRRHAGPPRRRPADPGVRWERAVSRSTCARSPQGPPGARRSSRATASRIAAPEPVKGTLFLAVRPIQVISPWQSLNLAPGFAAIHEIALGGGSLRVNVEKEIVLLTPPDGFGAGSRGDGELTDLLRKGALPLRSKARDADGLAYGAFRYDFDLAPQAARDVAPRGAVLQGAHAALAGDRRRGARGRRARRGARALARARRPRDGRSSARRRTSSSRP